MKPSAVYRKAAEMLFTGENYGYANSGYSCIAIDIADAVINKTGYGENRLTKPYVEMFSSSDGYGLLDEFGPTNSAESCNHRILALLLMSEIAKDRE